MAKSYVIADNREYPDYEFREFPKHLGFDAEGSDIEVKNADEESARIGDVAYPKPLGKDRHGKDVVAMWPHEESWKSKIVVAPIEPKAEEVRRGPGRPRTSEAA